MNEEISKMIEEEKARELELEKEGIDNSATMPTNNNITLPTNTDLAEITMQSAISQIQNGKKFGDVADDLFDARLTTDILNDDDKLSKLRDLKEKELQTKREAKIKQEEAEREKQEAEKAKQEAEKTKQNTEKIKEEGNQEKQNQENIYIKYEWCLRKVGIQGNVPNFQAYLAITFFTVLAVIYWFSIGAIIGILMMALDQVGQLALTIGNFLEKSAKAQKGLTKFIIFTLLTLLALGLVAGIVLGILYLKGILT